MTSSGNKGSGARDVKRGYGAERRAFKSTGSGNKKFQSKDKFQSTKKHSPSTTSDIHVRPKRHETHHRDNMKRSYTVNKKSTTAATFLRKSGSTATAYRRHQNHGARKSSNSITFGGSHHNGREHLPSRSRNSAMNKTGSFALRHTIGKTPTKRGTSKRHENKIKNSSVNRSNDTARRKQGSWRATGSSRTPVKFFVTLKTTPNNVSKRNSTRSLNMLRSRSSKNGGRESANTRVTKTAHRARGNTSSTATSSSSKSLKEASQKKTNKNWNAFMLGSNTNINTQSSNVRNVENRLKSAAEKTVGARAPVINFLLGRKEVNSQTSTQRVIRDTSVAFSKSGVTSERRAFRASNGSKSTDVVLGHGSASRLLNESSSAGNAGRHVEKHRPHVAYNESVWSGVGYPLVDNAFDHPRYRYLLSSRGHRKKGRAILRVRRIRRRQRKRKGLHENAVLPRAAVNAQNSSHAKLGDDMRIRSLKKLPDRVSSSTQEYFQNRQLKAHSDGTMSPAVASYVNRSKLAVPQLRKTTTTTVLPLKPQTTGKPEVFVTKKATISEKRQKVLRIINPPNENVIVQRRKSQGAQIQETPFNRVFSAKPKKVRHKIQRRPKLLSALHENNSGQRLGEKDYLVRRHRKIHHAHRRPRCLSSPSAHIDKAGKFVGGGLMWFPAASCVTSDLDWNSMHSSACLHQQIAFVHRYKVLAPPLHPVNENYTAGFCGSYVPWSHVTPHHVTDLLYDGSIVSGLSLHRFGFINPGGYTFELLPHTGRLILVGVPFHRRALSLCNLEPATLGLLFTGTGPRDGSLGMHRLGEICDRLEYYARTNTDNLYWGFPTVPVRTTPVAVRVPEASRDAITPVLPIAAESAEAFTHRVFTEPLALYPDAAVDYHETHTGFLEPVVFLANHVDRDVEYVDEDVDTPVFAEDMAQPIMDDHGARVAEAAAKTVAESAVNDGMSAMIDMEDGVDYVHPVVDSVPSDVIDAPDRTVDMNAPAEHVYDGVDEKAKGTGNIAGLDVHYAASGYYQEFAEPVVHVTVQILSFPAPVV
ncbi:uncharacterized protein LOC142805513 isoform X1 [Rhipicephalus microplus]|uniref:uncharacterized protein LOC142805513 isoform X1 n=1 Tax=Rhipicephalus microplus TaxID=6941 RepID=UPI003F6D9084